MRQWLLAGLLLAACRSPTFPELVTAANHRWEQAVCRTPRYKVLQYVSSIGYCGKKGDWWGCYDSSTGVLQVSRKTDPDRLLQTITHEMGHAIANGKHVAPNTGIMAPYVYQATPNITAADIELLCEDYECPCRNPEVP